MRMSPFLLLALLLMAPAVADDVKSQSQLWPARTYSCVAVI